MVMSIVMLVTCLLCLVLATKNRVVSTLSANKGTVTSVIVMSQQHVSTDFNDTTWNTRSVSTNSQNDQLRTSTSRGNGIAVSMAFQDSSKGAIHDEKVRMQISLQIANVINMYVPFVILSFGTVGNTLSFLTMMKKENRRFSTCLYMSVLSVLDTVLLWGYLFTHWLSL